MSKHRAARRPFYTFGNTFMFALLSLLLFVGCGGLPDSSAPVGLPAPSERSETGQEAFYAQLKLYGVTLPGSDEEGGYRALRRAMNACPEYTYALTEAQRVKGLQERFAFAEADAIYVYSALVLHVCEGARQ
jgi:hypothetical protein